MVSTCIRECDLVARGRFTQSVRLELLHLLHGPEAGEALSDVPRGDVRGQTGDMQSSDNGSIRHTV